MSGRFRATGSSASISTRILLSFWKLWERESEGEEKTVIVTGASRGIGRATALRLARDFANTVAVARGAVELEAFAREIKTSGRSALPVIADLRDPAAAQTVIDRALAVYGRIDAVVNIAGAVPQSDLFDLTDAQWDEGMALKFHGARRLTLAAWQALKATGGSVELTSGVSALTPKANLAAVGVINAAIAALAKTFSERGLKDGIQVNSIMPGAVMTDRRRAMLAHYAQAKNLAANEAADRFIREIGVTRYGTPEDIAALIAFLVSPAANWMTGVALRMDGGEIRSV